MSEGQGKRVVLVGHCVPDMFMLEGAIRTAAPGAEVVRNTREDDLWATPGDLLLVNRVLDGFYGDEQGQRIVAEAVGRGVPAMIISNFADAQETAVAAGGRPGFGKSEIRSEKATGAIRAALGLG